MAQFLILSLPRSRSKWLSIYLSYAGRKCGHDLAVECSSIKDFEERLNLVDGSAETGAMLGWKLIKEKMPKVKLLVIRRPVGEVADSFARHGITIDPGLLEARAAVLDACSASGVPSFAYSALDHGEVARAIFEYCLDLGWDQEWWEGLRQRNIQIDLPRRMHELWARREALGQFNSEVLAASQKLGSSSCLKMQ